MEFTLTYQGPLPPNQRGKKKVSETKAALREAFDPQLREQIQPYLPVGVGPDAHQNESSSYRYVVGRHLRNAVALSILLLTPTGLGKPGDNDNRVKTLIDGLACPQGPGTEVASPDPPVLCLLEDDDLVARYSLDSRPWLGRPRGNKDSLVLVNVKIISSGLPTEGGVILAG